MKRGMLVGLFVVILLIGIASAVFEIESSSVDKTYSAGQFISGDLEMNFNEQIDANFTSNFAGGISLLELLDKSGYDDDDFSCIPITCEREFKASNGDEIKVIDVGDGELFGFKIGGKDVELVSLKFDIVGNMGTSCSNQVKINLLNDKSIDFYNDNYVNQTCMAKDYGCYEEEDVQEAVITSDPYCEMINLTAGAAYRIGAEVKEGSTTGELVMELYEYESGDILGECILPEQTQQLEDISCIVEYSSLEDFNAFVCISAESGTDYKIKTETDNVCGMIEADPSEEFQRDYKIYAQKMRYGKVNKTFDEDVFEKLNPEKSGLIDVLQEYIDDSYNADCSDDCVIVFSVSGANGDATLDSLEIVYNSRGAFGTVSDKIYDVSEEKPKITGHNLSFEIRDMGFVAPEILGLNDFTLEFDGDEILEEEINISVGFSFDITPKIVYLGISTEFEAVSSKNITRSEWSFGDGKSGVSDSAIASHVYEQSGEYGLEVELESASGEKSKKTFTINVGNAKDSAEILIGRYESRIPNITADVNSFSPWIRSKLNEVFNVSELETLIDSIKTDFASVVEDTEYEEIVQRLINLDVPKAISVSLSGNVPFAVGYNNININHIEEIFTKEIEDEGRVKNSVMSWAEGNYQVNVEFQVISASKDSGKEDVLTSIKLDISPKKQSVEQAYLIIDYPLGGIKFKQEYGQQALAGGAYIPLSSGYSGSIEFLIPEFIEMSELGAHITPGIETLEQLAGEGVIGEAGGFPIGFIIIALSMLIGATLIVYIFLQEWYKRRYESFLFKSKDDLYNLINFIANGRKAKLDDKNIERKLKKSGWNNEQIGYATKKLEGKRTGMYEIPIFKFFEQKRVKKEIAKRRKVAPVRAPVGVRQAGARFIKRPKL